MGIFKFAALAAVVIFIVLFLAVGTKPGHIYVMRPINDHLYKKACERIMTANEVRKANAGERPKPDVFHIIYASRDIEPGEKIRRADLERRELVIWPDAHVEHEGDLRYYYYEDEIAGDTAKDKLLGEKPVMRAP